MISVLIATKNRPIPLRDCMIAVCTNSVRDIEILVVDQSDTDETKKTVDAIQDPRIKYLRDASTGKTKALNSGVSISKGEIIAFTDDDCIVTKNWIRTISNSFAKNPDIIGLFGSTLPYKPEIHRGLFCPSTKTTSKPRHLTKPPIHRNQLGFGNNMAFRRTAFTKFGKFKIWLGPNSLGSNAEDAEYALRMLVANNAMLYNPLIRVYHNRWITRQEMSTQELSYVQGEMACYSYWHTQQHSFANTMMGKNFVRFQKNLHKKIIGDPTISLWHEFQHLFAVFRGVCVGWYFAHTDPFMM